jgi:hypothetical protein
VTQTFPKSHPALNLQYVRWDIWRASALPTAADRINAALIGVRHVQDKMASWTIYTRELATTIALLAERGVMVNFEDPELVDE